MYIVNVIPIKKGILGEYLSYYHSDKLEPGTIVTIPIRLKEETAVVVESEEVLNLKSDIKNRNYQLKKIIGIKGKSPFSESFFLACEIAKKYFISNTGTIIKSLTPSLFIEKIDKLEKASGVIKKDTLMPGEKFIFQSNEQDRLAFYRTLIRESFAKKESIFICVPTKHDVGFFYKELSKGIESYVYPFHSELGSKKTIENYNNVILKDHPVLIIGTGIFLSIPRPDIKTIVLEKESAGAYKQITRPYIDIRSFVEILCFICNIKLIFGDSLLRPETLYRYEQGELQDVSPPSFRLFQSDNLGIVSMGKKDEALNYFQTISEDVRLLMEKTFQNNESIFLFSLRKGLAPMTICNDCKNILLCPSCSTPVVLYGPKQNEKNKDDRTRIFMCNKCGRKERTEINCPICNSWNLIPLGVGIDKVAIEVRNIFPDVEIFQIDKESARSPQKAKDIINNFYKTPKSVLLGTEMAFSLVENKIAASALISLDGLFSIPSFNMGQKIIHLIDKLTSITAGKVIIQTRVPDNKIIKSIISGNILPFLRNDIEERNNFGYPPFKRLVKITFEGSAKETEKNRHYLEKSLAEYDPQIFSAFVGKLKGNYITNTVLKVDLDKWPLIENNKKNIDSNLHRILSNLAPSYSVNVDPEDLL